MQKVLFDVQIQCARQDRDEWFPVLLARTKAEASLTIEEAANISKIADKAVAEAAYFCAMVER